MKIVNPGIRDRIEYLTGRLHVFADMALTFRDQEQKWAGNNERKK